MALSRSTEDEGDGYRYEKGAFATIPIRWDEALQTLTIGKRQGKFPGMLASHTFRIVWVTAGHGVGGAVIEKADQEIFLHRRSHHGSAKKLKPRSHAGRFIPKRSARAGNPSPIPWR